MASTIRCDIVSAEEEIFHGEVQMVVATGEMGELGIAPRHAPLITRLKPGQVRLTLANGEEQLFYLQSRGLTEAEASSMIVSGFIEPLVKELPMEYAVEMNRLIELQMEGSVG